jgi:hypothetical protein
MKTFFILALFFPLVGCGAAPILTRPIDAGAFEGRFSYARNGKWTESRGEDGDYFKPGDRVEIDIKTNSKAGRCVVKVTDGNFDRAEDCTGLSHVQMDLGKLDGIPGTNRQLNFVVSTDKHGSYQGALHMLLIEPVQKLPVAGLQCPLMSGKSNMLHCQRPAGFTLYLAPTFPEAGRALYTLNCNSGKSVTQEFEVTEAGSKRIDIPTAGKDLCFVTFAFRSATKKLSTLIFLRLYDQAYIPLAYPRAEGGELCLDSKDYKAVKVDGVDHSVNWFSSKCYPVQKEMMIWDAIGRFVSVRK